MDNPPESDPFLGARDDCPLLLYCGLDGKVLWMSDRGRIACGLPAPLVEDVLASYRPETLKAWLVWKARDGSIIGVLPPQRAVGASGDLIRLEGSLLAHFFRLLFAERRVSTLARRRRSGSGGRAIRQMELERRRLARELHTGVGQMLAAIRMQVEMISEGLPSAPPAIRETLDRIAVLATDTQEQIRSVARSLHPPEWERLDLVEAIRQLWNLSGIPQRFEASLELDPLPREPDLEVKVLLYRTLQEAVSNLMRHSKATRVSAALQVSEDRLVLAVSDDGVGFDVARVLRGPADVGGGIGLRSIREQGEALGGKVTVESGPWGTKLVVSVAPSAASW